MIFKSPRFTIVLTCIAYAILMISAILRVFIPNIGFEGYFLTIFLYCMLAIILKREQGNLRDYNIEGLGLILFVAYAYSQALWITFYFQNFGFGMVWLAIAIIETFAFAKGPKIEFKYSKDFSMNLFIGVMVGIMLALISFIINPKSYLGINSAQVRVLAVYVFMSTGMMEEFLYRGLIWGLMKKAGISENHIMLYQTGLFSLGHIYQFSVPFWFFVRNPFVGWFLGSLTKRTGMITVSIITHGIINALVTLL